MSSASYPVPPPIYTDEPTPTKPAKTQETPLVDIGEEPRASTSTGEGSPLLVGSSIANQVEVDDVPDDFKYGTTVAESAPQIRKAFVRKVYAILLVQIFTTIAIAGTVSQSKQLIDWVMNNLWAIFVPLIATLPLLILLQWKRHVHPLNLFLLAAFTLTESYVMGVAVAHYDNHIILQALGITFAVFLSLSAFTFQSKYDFSSAAPYALSSLVVLITASFIHILVAPFDRTTDVLITVTGCLIFGAFIVYDTHAINKRLSPDEFISGAISLYLDFVNLFLRILRLS
ncbi:hypothetical protein HMN09_00384700 [Mycena chlorophos]|uniref:Glutamate binding protein n=1 Tax=Mycena chlorophos TaxID=658473 RepID=A0A8H6TK28_MYCCL|nr:hypothetical protein HMN09_00384700 [Mycena chlorophos]